MFSGVRFKLRDVIVDPDMGVMSGSGGTVRLEPRVLLVLRFLADRPCVLVSRSDLLEGIWSGTDIYDEALTQCVYQLRQQLVSAGGDSDYRGLIRTVPKRGYVLEVAPAPVDPPSAGSDETIEPGSAPPGPGLRIWWAALVPVLTLVVGYYLSNERLSEPPAPKVVAVLPFLPLTEDDRDPALELGMADTLIARLSESDRIVVRPIAAVRGYADLDRDSLQAGSELSADAVIDGSIQQSGSDIRINVRLVQVSNGVALWSGTFDEAFSNIFSVQGEIAGRVAEALALPPDPREKDRMSPAGTANVAAYQSYLAGRYRLYKLTPLDLQASVGSFRDAVALDPGYAQAWVGLASALFRSPLGGEVPPKDFYPEAKAAAEKALALEGSLAEAYAMRGWIAFWYEWDWALAETQFQKAIALNPYDTEGHLGYAHLLANTGRFARALQEVRLARETSPLFLMAAVLEAEWLLETGRLDDAQRQLERVRDLDPRFWHARLELSDVYWRQGRFQEALQEAELAREHSGNATWAVLSQLGVLARAGRTAEASALRDTLLERATTRYVPPYDLALSSLALGDVAAALAWLEKGFEARDPKMTFIGVEDRWDEIRSRPEFIGLLRRMNLADINAGASGGINRWYIQAGPTRMLEGDRPMVSGSFQVFTPESAASSAVVLQGGACLIADLGTSGTGAAACTTDADCSRAYRNEPDDVQLQDFGGYCLSRRGEQARCWVRPGPAETYCRRSVDGYRLMPGRHELGPVPADPLGRAPSYPTWAVLACMAQTGHDRACGTPAGIAYRQVSVTPPET